MSASLAAHPLHLYARPSQAQPGAVIRVKQGEFDSLRCPEAALAAASFQITFEQAVERLQRLDRMFIELDGSFLWTGQDSDCRWQLDGMLYDDGQRLKRVELKGSCPLASWQLLLGCLDWPTQPLLAHWIEWNCFVAIEQLLRSESFLPHLRHNP